MHASRRSATRKLHACGQPLTQSANLSAVKVRRRMLPWRGLTPATNSQTPTHTHLVHAPNLHVQLHQSGRRLQVAAEWRGQGGRGRGAKRMHIRAEHPSHCNSSTGAACLVCADVCAEWASSMGSSAATVPHNGALGGQKYWTSSRCVDAGTVSPRCVWAWMWVVVGYGCGCGGVTERHTLGVRGVQVCGRKHSVVSKQAVRVWPWSCLWAWAVWT